MRVGDSPSTIDAAYTLREGIAAGPWTLVGDGIIAGDGVTNVTVQFEVRWRKAGALTDADDLVITKAQNTFQRDLNNKFSAVPFKTTVPGLAAPAQAGDLLVLRIVALRGDSGAVYILNGDGEKTNGEIPRLELPPASSP